MGEREIRERRSKWEMPKSIMKVWFVWQQPKAEKNSEIREQSIDLNAVQWQSKDESTEVRRRRPLRTSVGWFWWTCNEVALERTWEWGNGNNECRESQDQEREKGTMASWLEEKRTLILNKQNMESLSAWLGTWIPACSFFNLLFRKTHPVLRNPRYYEKCHHPN